MRKKNTHSSSEIHQIYHDFQIYRSLKSLQKTSNPYSVSRMSTTEKTQKIFLRKLLFKKKCNLIYYFPACFLINYLKKLSKV